MQRINAMLENTLEISHKTDQANCELSPFLVSLDFLELSPFVVSLDFRELLVHIYDREEFLHLMDSSRP